MKAARDLYQRDRNWLQQLARPARTAFSDTSITLSVDRGGKKSRISDFPDGKVGG